MNILKRLKKQRIPNIPRDCFSCGWFQFPTEGLRNRQCQCLRITGPAEGSNICREWFLDPNWRKRIRGAMGVVK